MFIRQNDITSAKRGFPPQKKHGKSVSSKSCCFFWGGWLNIHGISHFGDFRIAKLKKLGGALFFIAPGQIFSDIRMLEDPHTSNIRPLYACFTALLPYVKIRKANALVTRQDKDVQKTSKNDVFTIFQHTL